MTSFQRSWRRALPLLAALATSTSLARADEERARTIDVTACSQSTLGQELVSALLVETRVSSTVALAEPGVSADLFVTECDLAAGLLSVSVAGEENPLELSDVPLGARPRTAAVALVEWARSLTDPPVHLEEASPHTAPAAPSTSQQSPAPPPSRDEGSPRETTPDVPTPKYARFLEVGVGFQLAGSPSLAAPRLDLGIDMRLWKRLRGSLLVLGAATSRTSDLGRVNYYWVGGNAAVGLSLDVFDIVSVWGVLGVERLTAAGKSSYDVPTAAVHDLLITSWLRFKVKLPLTPRLQMGAVFDGGAVLYGPRFTVGGDAFNELSGLATSGRVSLSYGF